MGYSFFMSMALGVMISAPMGAVGMLCLRQCIYNGLLMGIAAGMACALADGVYAAIAAFGFSKVEDILLNHITLIKLAGIGFLASNGMMMLAMQAVPPEGKGQALPKHHKASQIINIFFTTLINPATIIAVPTGLAALGLLDTTPTHLQALSIATGVVVGTSLWWIIVASFVANHRHKVSTNALTHLNQFTGSILLICSGAIAYTL